jgi:hypothetical protein
MRNRHTRQPVNSNRGTLLVNRDENANRSGLDASFPFAVRRSGPRGRTRPPLPSRWRRLAYVILHRRGSSLGRICLRPLLSSTGILLLLLSAPGRRGAGRRGAGSGSGGARSRRGPIGFVYDRALSKRTPGHSTSKTDPSNVAGVAAWSSALGREVFSFPRGQYFRGKLANASGSHFRRQVRDDPAHYRGTRGPGSTGSRADGGSS